MKEFLKEAAAVKPSKDVLAWFDLGMYAFIHFGPNTFTNKEWGTGKEAVDIFAPEKLDCRQWAKVIKSAGFKAIILTAKHHDGFCLWPSKYTEHSVKNAKVKRDVVREVSEACEEFGLKFGVYLSPWDMNSELYGTEAYNDYFCNQLQELLTEYGDIFYVWFDNACGEGPNGKKQVYDFPRYIKLIKDLQPNALIFNDYGPDIRWCGNEAGKAREAEWAVVPSELCYYSEVQTGSAPMADEGDLSFIYSTHKDLGGRTVIQYSKGLTFTPAEVDMSIRTGWFWHPEEEPHSVERLFKAYLNSVGLNACLNLNIPPNTDGLIDELDIERLKEFRELLDQEFSNDFTITWEKLPGKSRTQVKYLVKVKNRPVGKAVKYVVLCEDISQGQRCESFFIEGNTPDGSMFPLYEGRTIGNCKICPLQDPFAEQNPLTRIETGEEEFIINITSARDEVQLKSIEFY